MEYIRITRDNIDAEHVCCAMSGKQALAKKEWLKRRFDEGLIFYRSVDAENASSNISPRRTRGFLSKRMGIFISTVYGSPAP